MWRRSVLVLLLTALARADELSFSPFVNVSKSNDYPSQVPAIAMGAGGIYITWLEQIDGADRIYFSRSLDLGRHFSTPVAIAGAPAGWYPDIAADDLGGVYIVWPAGPGLRFRYSTDRGETFSPTSTVPDTRRGSDESIACDEQGTIHLAWRQSGYGPSTRTGGTTSVFYSIWDRHALTITGAPSFSPPTLIGLHYMES